ncbi:unnamed protein product [Tetraodon nigroviridis]|uniref:Paraoxonase n=1 Tax=Tetraodon nigroviridis TaxID=99883 RepID=Q4RHU3_TETNG|nr:unnamed protein product [Tetraodon nigroviridis]
MAAMKKSLLAAVVAAFAVFVGHRFLKLKEVLLVSREVPLNHLNCQYLKHIVSEEPGKIYIVDLLHPKPTPVELQIRGNLDLDSFNPHGISVYADDADDSIYLFVVNHPQYKSQVEIFRFVEENTLEHLKTITHPLLHSVNDVVAVGTDSFYATNHASFPSEALHLLVSLLGLPWCDVVYYSPEEVRVAASSIMSANGINISPDRRLC